MIISTIISLIISSLILSSAPNLNLPFSTGVSPLNGFEKASIFAGRTRAAIYDSVLGAPDKNFIISPEKKPFASKLEAKALSAIVIDEKSGEVLFNKNSAAARPIASLSKLMAALVVAENNPDWDSFYKIKKDDIIFGGRSHVYYGDEIRLRDLFSLSLVASDNTSTFALGSAQGWSSEQFVQKMNAKAAFLGLSGTNFTEPVGLSKDNISTARDLTILIKEALAESRIKEAVLLKRIEFKTRLGRSVSAESTDKLLDDFSGNSLKLLGGKTGYTEEAGYCFAALFSDKAGNQIISVILGAFSDEERFSETKKAISWVYDNYQWKKTES